MTDQTYIYKILRPSEYEDLSKGQFHGSDHDKADGFLHFSTRTQLAETLAKHYAGQTNLTLAEIAVAKLPNALKWDPAREGDLFPHLYAPLSLTAVTRHWSLSEDAAGVHILPLDLEGAA